MATWLGSRTRHPAVVETERGAGMVITAGLREGSPTLAAAAAAVAMVQQAAMGTPAVTVRQGTAKATATAAAKVGMMPSARLVYQHGQPRQGSTLCRYVAVKVGSPAVVEW